MVTTAAIEELRTMFEAIRDERKMYANTATRVGNAFLSLLEYLIDAPFIRKDRDDETAYLLTLLKGAVVGESHNIRLNPDGSIRCGRIVVEGSAIFNELVFNHQNVLEGDTYFTDRGIIEKVEHVNLGEYKLTFRKMHDNDRVTFHVNDILKCATNNLDVARTYTTSWMRVESVNLEENTCNVTLYNNADVPGGVNYPPQETSRSIRWGNTIDPNRQQTFFVSSVDGTFLFLQGVDAPIIDDRNISAFLGIPPQMDCLRDLPINARQPYIYARGLIVEDIIRIDYQGNPQYTARDKGQWKEDGVYIHGYDATAKGYFSDRVWHGGCLWQCAVSAATVGTPPRFNNTEWVCLIGGKNMSVDIYSTEGDWFRAGTDWTTDLIANVYNAEMRLTEEEIGKNHITWMRQSDDADGDTAWNIKHPSGSQGLTLTIDSTTDLPSTWSAGSRVGFICAVTFPDGETYSADYSIVM